MTRSGRAVRVPAGGDDGMTWEPLDLSKPNVARTYDALIGGHDNFAADRERLLEICPDLGSAVRENRSFTARAATGQPGGASLPTGKPPRVGGTRYPPY